MADMDPPFTGGFPYKFASNQALIAPGIPPDEVKLIPWIAKRALAIPAESVDEHSAHLFVTHENLRRLYQLDVQNKYALYEEVSIPLSIWQLKNEPVYEATYENLSAWRTTEVTKALVKGLLSCIMTMHDKGFCLGEELTSDHVCMHLDSPKLLIKTTSIHVLHPSDDLIRDYKRFGQFVRSVIFGRCTIPDDMDSFLLLLEDKRVDESKLYLLERHASVSNAQQRIDFLMRVVTKTRALERIVMSSFIKELNKWDFGYNKPWRDCIPLNSDAHNVYTFKKRNYAGTTEKGNYAESNLSHCCYMLNFCLHSSPPDYSIHLGNNTGQNLSREGMNAVFIDNAISVMFPRSISMIQNVMREKKIVKGFLL